MKISTKGRYALRMMVDLAASRKERAFVSLRDVSGRQDVSMKYLEQIVNQLTKAGLLQSVRGPKGGYRLAKEPESYTVGEILRVTEGSLAPVACLDCTPNTCKRAAICPVLYVWEGLYQHILTYLDDVTLQDILCHGSMAEVKEAVK